MKPTFIFLLQVLPLLVCATSLPDADSKQVVFIGGRQYYFSELYVTSPEAVSTCEELGMTLVGLETVQEFDAVTNYLENTLRRNDYHWTSGSRQIDNWVWTNTGTTFNFFRWAAGQPNVVDNTLQLHLAVANNLMYNLYPTWDKRFICEEKTLCATE